MRFTPHMKPISSFHLGSRPIVCLLGLLLLFSTSCGQADNSSLKVAQSAIDPKYQDQVFWIKAEGTPSQLNEWTYYFYDPTASSKTRLVKVVNGRIDRAQVVEFRSPASESLVFDPHLNKVSAEQALQKTSVYAAGKQIKYDSVKMQLRRPSSGAPPVWTVSLYQGTRFAGTVRLNDMDGTVASYQTAPASSASNTASGFANDVESTFRGVGADLEEFFTGERTVDK